MKKLGFIIVLALFLGNTGCSNVEEGSDVISDHVQFTLRNDSNEDTHMWITGEDIGPNNKIAPGKNRTVTYQKSAELMDMNSGVREDVMTVYAGRNGVVLASRTYNVSYYDDFLTARFNGSSVK